MLGKAVLVFTLLAATPLLVPAETAEMALCRPYAAQLAQFMVKYVWLRAYNNCIADENEKPPQLPTDWQSALQQVVPPTEIGEVSEPISSEVITKPVTPEITPAELDKIGTKPATGRIKAKKVKTVPVHLPDETKVASLPPEEPVTPDKADKPVKTGRSGFAKGTAEWNAYCKKYWPASFDAKTGTVIRSRHKRIQCPA